MTDIEREITCPCCGYGIEVEIDGGEPPDSNYPNGDGHPGIGASVTQTIGCGCLEYLERVHQSVAARYEEQILSEWRVGQ